MIQRRAEMALALRARRGSRGEPGDRGGGEWAHQLLNSRRVSIAGGTDEIQRNNVSERVLGLPGSLRSTVTSPSTRSLTTEARGRPLRRTGHEVSDAVEQLVKVLMKADRVEP